MKKNLRLGYKDGIVEYLEKELDTILDFEQTKKSLMKKIDYEKKSDKRSEELEKEELQRKESKASVLQNNYEKKVRDNKELKESLSSKNSIIEKLEYKNRDLENKNKKLKDKLSKTKDVMYDVLNTKAFNLMNRDVKDKIKNETEEDNINR